ncbi:MAG: hypothetical protein MUF58_13495 [Arcicella sp.]|jgi:hypothetical protein|nr:hypothetical protein [Arcicella sp.]
MELTSTLSQLLISILVVSGFVLLSPRVLMILHNSFVKQLQTQTNFNWILAGCYLSGAIFLNDALSIARGAVAIRPLEGIASVTYFAWILSIAVLVISVLNFIYLKVGIWLSKRLVRFTENIEPALVVAAIMVLFAWMSVDTIHVLLQSLLIETHIQDIH